jgi:hypothetical protein
MVRAYLSSDQTVSAGATETVEFNTENFDTNGEYNTGTYTYTAKGKRLLRVKAQVRVASVNAETYVLNIRKNATNVSESAVDVTANADLVMSVDDLVDVVAGDTINILFRNTDASDRLLTGATRFTYLTIEEVS